jgi:hypothetical protein
MYCEIEKHCLGCDVCENVKEPELPRIKCGECKQQTWEIHGEWISSNGRHDLIGQCLNCNPPDG